jgi:hypothetical protein
MRSNFLFLRTDSEQTCTFSNYIAPGADSGAARKKVAIYLRTPTFIVSSDSVPGMMHDDGTFERYGWIQRMVSIVSNEQMDHSFFERPTVMLKIRCWYY